MPYTSILLNLKLHQNVKKTMCKNKFIEKNQKSKIKCAFAARIQKKEKIIKKITKLHDLEIELIAFCSSYKFDDLILAMVC